MDVQELEFRDVTPPRMFCVVSGGAILKANGFALHESPEMAEVVRDSFGSGDVYELIRVEAK